MPTPAELANFYWYCAAAAQLIEQLPGNAATRSVSRHAVRNATNALTGNKGVPYASVAARKVCMANGGSWERCGLRREHAIPVGHIHRELVAAIWAPRSDLALAEARGRLDEEMAATPVKSGAFAGFPSNPRIAIVVDIIRASTALAWLTEEEDDLLKARLGDGSWSLNQRMPPGWDGKDPLARYRFCKIDVLEI
ncbi:TPA: hypothetical protein ACXIGC_000146 [Stenotrophomonas maltophilia]